MSSNSYGDIDLDEIERVYKNYLAMQEEEAKKEAERKSQQKRKEQMEREKRRIEMEKAKERLLMEASKDKARNETKAKKLEKMDIDPNPQAGTSHSRESGRVPPKRPMLTTPEAGIETKNRFELLASQEDDLQENSDGDSTIEQQTTSNRNENKNKQPPIVTNGVALNHKEFVQELAQFSRNFTTYPNSRKNQITIITYDKTERCNIIKYLHSKGMTCHTYTDSAEKKMSYVIKGLEGDWTEEEVSNDIKAQGVPLLKINKMKNTRASFYVATTDKTVQLKDFRKIQTILHTRVRVELYVNRKQITQCKRCQRWGHVIANCSNEWSCVRCGEAHASYMCPKKDKNLYPAKCVNCGEAHPSSSVNCVVYKQKLEIMNKKKKAPEAKTERVPKIERDMTARSSRQWPALPRRDLQPTVNEESAAANDLTELRHELNILSELIDIKKMIAKYRKINAKLRLINDIKERELVFLEEILNYD